MARGRARRRHRVSAVAGLSVAGAAAGTALALGLTGVLGPARTPGTIRTASFTLASNSNGTATLTINPKELLDPTALQSDLAQYGIPAKVTSGSFCSSDPHPAGFCRSCSMQPTGPGTSTPQSGVQPTITIDPSAMPAGAELSVGYFQLGSGEDAGEQQAGVVLIDSNSYACTSNPPDPNGPPEGSAGWTVSGCCTAAPARPACDPPRAEMAPLPLRDTHKAPRGTREPPVARCSVNARRRPCASLCNLCSRLARSTRGADSPR